MASATDILHPRVAEMPRVKLVWERDWMRGPGLHWQIGAYWDANPWPRESEMIYRRQFVFRISLDTGRWS